MINNPFNIKNFYNLLLLQPQVICIQTALRAITLSAILHTHSKKAKNHYLIARCSFPIASYPFIIGKPFQQPIFQSQRTTNSELLYLIFYNYFQLVQPSSYGCGSQACLNILVLFRPCGFSTISVTLFLRQCVRVELFCNFSLLQQSVNSQRKNQPLLSLQHFCIVGVIVNFFFNLSSTNKKSKGKESAFAKLFSIRLQSV